MNQSSFTAKIDTLALNNYRNYTSEAIEVRKGPIVLHGANGSGKTNILEAISFLNPGKGLRRSRLRDIDNQFQKETMTGWGIQSQITTPKDTFRLSTGRDPNQKTSDKRIIKIDDVEIDQDTLTNKINVLWITPELDRLFIEARQTRRQFLDYLVHQFDNRHRSRLRKFESLQRERMKALQFHNADDHWLDIIEEQLVELGTAISAQRVEVLRDLNQFCEYQSLFPRVKIIHIGELEEKLTHSPCLVVEELYREKLKTFREKDRQLGKTHFGPHRLDWTAKHIESGMQAQFCSTGEQKILLLSIVLACAELLTKFKEASPILLFDEVAAHLDIYHRRALFDKINALEAQAWYTGTDLSLFNDLQETGQFIRVKNGKLYQNNEI